MTELAVVLVIVALLLGGLLAPLSVQYDGAKATTTQKLLDETVEALIGFALANGRLPCPDTNLDGIEDTNVTVQNDVPLAGQSTQTVSGCPNLEGLLPFQTLGTARTDSWGRRFRYRVTSTFARSTIVWSGLGATGTQLSTVGVTLSNSGDIRVRTRGDNPGTAGVTEAKFLSPLTSSAPAVVISFGKDGYGAIDESGNPLPSVPAANADETLNAAIGNSKISRIMTPSTGSAACDDNAEDSPFCEFDDLVVWLSPNILFNRMVAAGRLP